MLTRIVKMNFQSPKIEEFKVIFSKYGDQIRSAEGCHSVDLLQDVKNPSIFFTYSKWDSEVYLNKYRDSELFAEVWKQTKALFVEKAEAWSVEVLA
jgi:autoinducer 2-degrading protein